MSFSVFNSNQSVKSTITSKMDQYKMNYDAIMMLPVVQELIRKNKRLRKENKSLKNLIYSLPEFRCNCKPPACMFNQTCSINFKQEQIINDDNEPTQCDTLADNDDEVVIVNSPEKQPNIVYVLEEAEEEEAPVEAVVEVEVEAEEEEVEVEAEEEEAEEEEVEEEAEEEEVEEEEVEAEEEAEEEEVEVEVEVEAEDEAVEEEAEEEAVEEESEVFEIEIAKKSYYTNNETNGIIYAIDSNEEVGDEVGVFVNGKPKFHKK